MSVTWGLGLGATITFPSNGNLLGTYMRGWWQSPAEATHGRLLEREVLSRVDPDNPGKPGAVLLCVRRISRAILDAHTSTVPTAHEGFLEVMYVASGAGRVEVGDRRCEVREGSMMLFPAKMTHTIINDGDEPLELIVMLNDYARDLEPEKEFKHSNYHDNPIAATTWHWHHIGYPVNVGAGLGTQVIGIDAMQIAEPHAHGPAKSDEVWYQLKGTSLLLLGNEIARQKPGQAFNCPPNTPHTSINDSCELMKWLYINMRGLGQTWP